MSKVEWVRTAIAVESAGSVTAGAAERGLSQPAASQQLAHLERALGFELFERSRRGVAATDDGARFLREVATPLEQIEWLLSGLERGAAEMPDLPLVLSCAPEWFEHHAVRALDSAPPVRARFGLDDGEAFEQLRAGRVDVAITHTYPGASAGTVSHALAARRYVLVAAPSLADDAAASAEALGEWVRSTPWVGFSEELPLTRRVWAELTGSVAPTEVRVVVPDIRAALAAVEAGMGASLIPDDVSADALRHGRVVAMATAGIEHSPPPWVLTIRASNPRAAEVRQLVEGLLAAGLSRTGG